jgi:aspartyl-tRNA(Asn)/glutamyl-tRNA(Gln) amidotransferase subunit C
MSLTLMDVRAIADLARLELERDEEEAMLGQLNAFFRIVEQMGTVDTSGVEPLYTPLSAVQAVEAPLRDDVVTETDHRAENMRNAPAADAGLFLVPRVIE